MNDVLEAPMARQDAGPDAAPVEVALLRDRGALAMLEGAWDRLLEASDAASPFLSPGWQSAWLDSYGRGHRLFVLAAWRGGRLAGLWPLALRRRGVFRVLVPIGSGRSDWLDILVNPAERTEVVAAMVDCLARERRHWDLLDQRDFLADSPTLPVLRQQSAQRHLRLRQEPRTVAPWLDTGGSWDDLLAAKSPKFRKNLKQGRRLAAREGELHMRRAEWQGEATVTTLAEVERRSWKARVGNVKLGTTAGRAFYQRMGDALARRGWLELWLAELQGECIAYIVNIGFGGKTWSYNAAYDERRASMSPGLLLTAEAIADSCALRRHEYDFLSGDEAYKLQWSTGQRAIDHVALSHGGPRSWLAWQVLVQARWVARRSESLRSFRSRLLVLGRRLLRRQAAP